MTMFKTAYGEHKSSPSPSGRPMKNEYGYEVNKKGQKVLVKTGETNLQEKIQAEYEDCLIENIMAKAAQGDMSNFRPDGIYADVSNVPNNLVEAMQQINSMETMWSNLPIEIKAKYNHSVEEFVGKSGTDEWLKDMGLIGAEVENVNEVTQELPNAAALGQVKDNAKEVEA